MLLAANEWDSGRERGRKNGRCLFQRVCLGYYELKMDLTLRSATLDGAVWVPVYHALNLALVAETALPAYRAALLQQLQR